MGPFPKEPIPSSITTHSRLVKFFGRLKYTSTMIVYKDIISGDELFSDAFEIEENFQGAFYKLKPKKIKIGATQLDGAAFGFNASEEGGDDEGVDDSGVVMKWDVEDQHQLETVPPFANSKDFCKKVKGILEEEGKEDEAKEWMKQAASGLA